MKYLSLLIFIYLINLSFSINFICEKLNENDCNKNTEECEWKVLNECIYSKQCEKDKFCNDRYCKTVRKCYSDPHFCDFEQGNCNNPLCYPIKKVIECSPKDKTIPSELCDLKVPQNQCTQDSNICDTKLDIISCRYDLNNSYESQQNRFICYNKETKLSCLSQPSCIWEEREDYQCYPQADCKGYDGNKTQCQAYEQEGCVYIESICMTKESQLQKIVQNQNNFKSQDNNKELILAFALLIVLIIIILIIKSRKIQNIKIEQDFEERSKMINL